MIQWHDQENSCDLMQKTDYKQLPLACDLCELRCDLMQKTDYKQPRNSFSLIALWL